MTYKSFEAIKKQKPKRLFVASDGPRAGRLEEEQTIVKLRHWVLENINWECEVKTLFRDSNLGCGKSVSNAITWFFNSVEYGIIIEDDCVLHKDFFSFAGSLLIKYQHNPKIQFIGGSNFQNDKKRDNGSFYFSNYCHVWGWATWKRVWDNYEYNLENMNLEELKVILKNNFTDLKMQNRWYSTLSQMKLDPLDTWDYQLIYSIWRNNGVAIIPNVNMVSNIGFGKDATHTLNKNSVYANNSCKSLTSTNNLVGDIKVDKEADRYFFYNYENRTILKRLSNKLKIFINLSLQFKSK